MSDLSLKIRDYMNKQRIEIVDLAKKTGINPKDLYKMIEENKKEISANDYYLICRALKVKYEFFFNYFIDDFLIDIQQ